MVPALLTLTLPAFSSISSTSISPSRWPSVKMYDCSDFGPSPGFPGGGAVFIKTRLFPRIVVMPVKVILTTVGLLTSAGSAGGAGGFKLNTLRSTML
jgi:hypothetical protein